MVKPRCLLAHRVRVFNNNEIPLKKNGLSKLLLSVPTLLGCHPHNSLVVLPYTAQKGATFDKAVREDLCHLIGGRSRTALLMRTARDHHWSSVVLLVVGGRPPAGGRPPMAGVVDNLVEHFGLEGIAVPCTVWVPEIRPGVTWLRYRPLQPHTGRLGEAESAHALHGHASRRRTLYGSFAEIEQDLAPQDPATAVLRMEVMMGLLEPRQRRTARSVSLM
ncbi:DUF4192 family protein, partial [Crossiella equi]|uniref:DUF4192 family protein n=1 Tax=Crossiella equi TaxID=130796 RepID=UPI0013023EB3